MTFVHARFAVDLLRAWTRTIRRGKIQTDTRGFIYGFVPVGSDRILKLGKTRNSKGLRGRARNYHGMNTVKHVIFDKAVEDCHETERVLLKFATEHGDLTKRNDLGKEWFETGLGIFELKKVFGTFVSGL